MEEDSRWVPEKEAAEPRGLESSLTSRYRRISWAAEWPQADDPEEGAAASYLPPKSTSEYASPFVGASGPARLTSRA
jgi:hypothetical protein